MTRASVCVRDDDGCGRRSRVGLWSYAPHGGSASQALTAAVTTTPSGTVLLSTGAGGRASAAVAYPAQGSGAAAAPSCVIEDVTDVPDAHAAAAGNGVAAAAATTAAADVEMQEAPAAAAGAAGGSGGGGAGGPGSGAAQPVMQVSALLFFATPRLVVEAPGCLHFRRPWHQGKNERGRLEAWLRKPGLCTSLV